MFFTFRYRLTSKRRTIIRQISFFFKKFVFNTTKTTINTTIKKTFFRCIVCKKIITRKLNKINNKRIKKLKLKIRKRTKFNN